MRITDMQLTDTASGRRASAVIIWEDNERPSQEIFFEVEKPFSAWISANPHAFLVAAIIPAFHHQEKRVVIDADICPRLTTGLNTVMAWLRYWFYDQDKALVQIEARGERVSPPKPARAGLFFSGGVDSFAALQINRLYYSRLHPDSFRNVLMIYGQNIESDTRRETFRQAVHMLSEVVAEKDATLVPVHTNIRSLETGSRFFLYEFQGAIMASVAHALAARLSSAAIASSDNMVGLRPYGSHPLLDPHYGSADLWIDHTDMALTRLDKMKHLADWPSGVQSIRVCGANWPGANCGHCEKCVRTMLELLVVGALAINDAFPDDDVSAELVLSAVQIDSTVDAYYQEMLAPLLAMGRSDLAQVIQGKLDQFVERQKRAHSRVKIKQLDEKYLHGNLSRLYRTFKVIG
ncbi:MAG TPA: hypothetical protein EYH05_20755 [Anaerolineae bacterium]|nr:hypothetical protein [Anaerolineae bacterium]